MACLPKRLDAKFGMQKLNRIHRLNEREISHK